MIRVLVVDDSPLFQNILARGLERDPDIRVVGKAASAEQAVAMVSSLEPDVVTLDVVMPGKDGFAAVKEIMARRPTPIVVVSSLERHTIVFPMLAAGALDVIGKPGSGGDFGAIAKKIKDLAAVHLKPAARSRFRMKPPSMGHGGAVRRSAVAGGRRLVVIASSAGGPQALAQLVGQLPPGLPATVVVIQHIAMGFGQGLANWLAESAPLPVRVAAAGEMPHPGEILIAPDDAHLVFLGDRRLAFDRTVEVKSQLRPAADVTFRSAADAFGRDLLAVVLTGMGSDGAEGAQHVREMGGRVVVQDEATSTVYGMPHAARPFANAEFPLSKMADEIIRFAHGR
ncbi:MAG TPA: chemotaxis protein CheB [Thermoanaerobaculia bacterium]|nr:chemotaxis protein CheB [Thermoanaerobaculia bacterium]